MTLQPLRLSPGADLRATLTQWASGQPHGSAFLVAGIGSLVDARLRFAGAPSETVVRGPLEIISVCGTLSPDGAHLHMTVSDAQGRVWGGHVGAGCAVRTTAELLLAASADWALRRRLDPATGYLELMVERPAPEQ